MRDKRKIAIGIGTLLIDALIMWLVVNWLASEFGDWRATYLQAVAIVLAIGVAAK